MPLHFLDWHFSGTLKMLCNYPAGILCHLDIRLLYAEHQCLRFLQKKRGEGKGGKKECKKVPNRFCAKAFPWSALN